MSNFRKILKNTSYLIFSEQVSALINMFQVVILIRYLGKSDYGVWSVTQSFPGMFLVLTDIGLNSIMLRKIAREKSKQELFFQQVILLKLMLGVVFLTAMYGFTYMFRYEPEVRGLIMISCVAYSVSMFSEIIIAVFRALENFIFEAIINTLRNILFFFLVLAIVFLNFGLSSLLYSLLVVNLFVATICFLWYGRKHHINLKVFDIKDYIELIKGAMPFALHNLVSPMFMQIGIVMLSKLSTFESVGIYNAPFRIIVFLYFIPSALHRTLFPSLSMHYVNSLERYQDIFKNACRLALLVALPASIGLFLISGKLVPLVFSSQYLQSVVPLKILAISVLFHYLRLIFSVALYASNNERIAVLLYGAGAVLNAGLNFILIPRLDYTGAALALLFSEIFICLAYYFTIRRRLFSVNYFGTALKILGSGVLMGFAVILTNSFSIFIQITIAVVFYGILINVFKVITPDEFKAMKKWVLIRK